MVPLPQSQTPRTCAHCYANCSGSWSLVRATGAAQSPTRVGRIVATKGCSAFGALPRRSKYERACAATPQAHPAPAQTDSHRHLKSVAFPLCRVAVAGMARRQREASFLAITVVQIAVLSC